MRKGLVVAASLALLAGACGRGGESKDGVTAQERDDLDNAAAMVEDNSQMIDTSADSLTLNEGAVPDEPANAAGGANASTASGNSATGNQQR